MDLQKEKFLRNEFQTMSVLGALGRSKTYSEDAKEEDKNHFRNVLREKLEEISIGYKFKVTEEEHLSNITRLSNELSSEFSHCLKNGRFRIGIAQKALNLYLKYLWCVKLIAPPPHCPFDSIVISYLPNCKDLQWTSIDSIEKYRMLVSAAREVAKDKPIPEWELEVWLNRVQSGRAQQASENQVTEKRHKGRFSEQIQTNAEEGSGAMILGTIVRPNFYADGNPICEIIISQQSAGLLPHERGQKIPIDISIGQNIYEAGVHETAAGVVWISSVIYKKEKDGRREKNGWLIFYRRLDQKWAIK